MPVAPKVPCKGVIVAERVADGGPVPAGSLWCRYAEALSAHLFLVEVLFEYTCINLNSYVLRWI